MVPRSFVELLGRLQACVPQRSPAQALSHILEVVDYKAHLLASLVCVLILRWRCCRCTCMCTALLVLCRSSACPESHMLPAYADAPRLLQKRMDQIKQQLEKRDTRPVLHRAGFGPNDDEGGDSSMEDEELSLYNVMGQPVSSLLS